MFVQMLDLESFEAHMENDTWGIGGYTVTEIGEAWKDGDMSQEPT